MTNGKTTKRIARSSIERRTKKRRQCSQAAEEKLHTLYQENGMLDEGADSQQWLDHLQASSTINEVPSASDSSAIVTSIPHGQLNFNGPVEPPPTALQRRVEALEDQMLSLLRENISLRKKLDRYVTRSESLWTTVLDVSHLLIREAEVEHPQAVLTPT
ncbi:hypothetical protein CC2G_001748 [Coprinopsis cinerea AmutBmut pab1-1]|nr:hypothetical protein CC2G_001748 [Coprinopsis cinerea AmutBmut pab1-1]